MKTLHSSGHWLALGVLCVSLMLCAGCDERTAQAQPLPAAPDALLSDNIPPSTPTLAAVAQANAAPPEAKPVPPLPSGPAAAATNPAVQAALQSPAPAPPDAVRISPGLADVLRLVHAGVSEDLLLAYVTNSMHVFEIGPGEIVYLHDLGVSDGVIARLIQHDSSPNAQARRQAMGAVQPLPPGAAIQEPATNLFQHAQKLTPWPAATPHEVGVNAPPPQSISVAAAQDTNAPAAVTLPEQTAVAGHTMSPQPAAYTYFETALAPYGTWFNVEGYGQCWRPTVAVLNASWRPYADHGRWLWSDSGWYWYSDYTWGWAPFHYGRWHHTAHHGWHWVPGTRWGPSWVTWRYTDGHCGWAPLPPTAYYHHGHGFYHNTVSVGLHYGFGLADFHYTFVPFNRFCDRAPYHYYLPRSHAYAVYKNSTVVNNYVSGDNNVIINHGVGIEKVARVTRGDIRKVAIRDAAEPRSLAVRRERLGPDGQSLTVTRTPALPESITQKSPSARGSAVYPGAATAVQKGGVPTATARVAPIRDAATTVKREAPAAKSVLAPTVSASAPAAPVPSGNAGVYSKPAGRVAEYQARRIQPNVPAPTTTDNGKSAAPVATPVAPAPPAGDPPKGSIVMRGRQGATSASAGSGRPLPSWAVPSPVGTPAVTTTSKSAGPAPAAPVPKATSVVPAPPAAVVRVPSTRVESYQVYRAQPLPSAGRSASRAYAPPSPSSPPPSAAPAARGTVAAPAPPATPAYRPGMPSAPRVESARPAPAPSGNSGRSQNYRGSGGYSRGFN